MVFRGFESLLSKVLSKKATGFPTLSRGNR